MRVLIFAASRIRTRYPARERLRAFLDNGYHGDMDWMARDPERRAHPAELWSQVRSVIVLGMNYAPPKTRCPICTRDKGVISVYAQRRDYHDVIKKKLKTRAMDGRAIRACGG